MAMQNGDVFRPFDYEDLKLPPQLSPAVLAVLLQDLIEYNGVSYRTVPIRTFRGKFIGLYFGSIESRACEAFLDYLRSFYVVMNHKFECVLVSSDGTDEAYARHTQMTSWPSFPRGDLRAVLLRSHFNIQECPKLIIVDANGVVVTSKGVENILEDEGGFPWTERIVDSLWGESTQAKPEKGLRGVLEDLNLPVVDGVSAIQRKFVGLLFGELWCPDTRDLINRLAFLLDRVSRRVGGERLLPVASRFVVYHCHCEELQNYQNFLSMQVSFPTVHINDEFRRQATQHFLGVDEHPKFCIVSPQEGWIIQDGATWLKRDPTGVCFPWQPKLARWSSLPLQAPAGSAGDGFLNVLSEVTDENISSALVKGPVFIAFLANVGAHRVEAIATLRAAASAYLSRVADRSRAVKENKLDLRGFLADENGIDDDDSLLNTLRRDLSRPARPNVQEASPFDDDVATIPPSPKRGTQTQGKVLWKVLQKAVEKQTTLHGSAPWNNPGVGAYTATRSSMSFLYSSLDDQTTAVLSKFCCIDAKHLAQHQLWRRVQAQIEAKESHTRSEMLQQFSQVSADATSLHAPMSSVSMNEEAHREHLMSVDGVPASVGLMSQEPGLSEQSVVEQSVDIAEEDSELTKEVADDELKTKASPFMPRSKNSAVSKATAELLGDGICNNGTAMIIDLMQGAYYVCGNLTDKETILRFLDAWDQDALDPFEIRLPNPEEMIKDEDSEMAREMAVYTQQVQGVPGMLPDMGTVVIPGIVIWIPSKQHSESHMSPDSIFRSLLNLAFQKCPREDQIETYNLLDQQVYDPDDEDTCGNRKIKKFTPWIEKMWIFGLLDTPEAAAETDIRAWDPPQAHFLADLYHYTDDLVKRGGLDAEQESASSDHRGSSSVGGLRSSVSKHHKSPVHVNPVEEMLIPPTELFDAGLHDLRASFMDEHALLGNYNVCLRTARTRRALHAAMLDEIGYHSLIQYLPPPLFILLVGDLPHVDLLPWPSVFNVAHLHVLGSVPSVSSYRSVSPAISVQCWNSWAESAADERILPAVAQHIAVPWR